MDPCGAWEHDGAWDSIEIFHETKAPLLAAFARRAGVPPTPLPVSPLHTPRWRTRRGPALCSLRGLFLEARDERREVGRVLLQERLVVGRHEVVEEPDPGPLQPQRQVSSVARRPQLLSILRLLSPCPLLVNP